MSSRWSRRTILGAGAVGTVGALSLAACTSGTEDEEPWRALGTTPQRIRLTDLELERSRPGPFVESPHDSYEVTATGMFPSFTQEELEQMFPDEHPPSDGLTAPEGAVLLVATFHREYLDDLRWPAEARVGTSLRILFDDVGGARSSLELDPETREEDWLLQVPADPAPDQAVLELEVGGKIRQLSLVDGSRVHDELAYLADRHRGVEVRTGVADHESLFEAEAVDADGGTDTVALLIGDGIVAPASTTLGWPSEGTQLVGVTVYSHQRYTPPEQYQEGAGWDGEMALPCRPEGCVLILPDGTEIAQSVTEEIAASRVVDGHFDVGSRRVWFEVPMGVGTATVQLRLALCPRREGLAALLDADAGAEVELVLTEEAVR